MGEVYRARHGMMRRPSAIKLLRGGAGQCSNLTRLMQLNVPSEDDADLPGATR